MNSADRRQHLVGLFHFNIRYIIGDESFYRRYCTEIIEPFLEFVHSVPGLRLSVHFSGCDLEYLAEEYPSILGELKHHIDNGRIELVSSLYAPALWVAFPRVDLIRSIALNRRVLDRLELKTADIFFSQESFFGPGIGTLGEYFSTAICKDDYLKSAAGLSECEPVYQLGDIKVLVGSGHLLNGLRSWDTEFARDVMRLGGQRAELRKSPGEERAPSIVTKGAATWYHCGSAHHLVTGINPHRRDRFFADLDWIQLVKAFLAKETPHAQYCFLSEVTNAELAAPVFPQTIEGSWNFKESDGVFAWMGKHSTTWECDASILAGAWRSRAVVTRIEEKVASEEGRDDSFQEKIDVLWKQQLMAEASDPLGWRPRKIEVAFGKAQSQQVLDTARSHRSTRSAGVLARAIAWCEATAASMEMEGAWMQPQPLGGCVLSGWHLLTTSLYYCRVELQVGEERKAGVRFQRDAEDTPLYSPSAMEESLVRLAQNVGAGDSIYLPLSNGLISLSDSRFLIRMNHYSQIAARVSSGRDQVEFSIEGPPAHHVYSGLFFLYAGSAHNAMNFANTMNEI